MKSSGTLVVLLIVVAGLFVGATTWWRYSTENPTSSDATLTQLDGQWIARANFPGDKSPDLLIGTGAIITCTRFPDTRITGVIERINEDHSVVILIDQDLPQLPDITSAPAHVTIDAATAPQ